MKALQIRNSIFWAMNAIFVVLVAVIFTGMGRLWGPKLPSLVVINFLAVTLLTLAVALVVMTLKLKGPLTQRMFFILTGASAAAIPICAVLHNVVYGLFFYGKKEGDEPVFFILALLVFPVLFILGSLGSIIVRITCRLRKKKIAC